MQKNQKDIKKTKLVTQKEVQDFLKTNKDIVAQEIICGLCM